MDLEFIAPVLEWTASHPAWSGLLVFLVAFSESLALVGLFMPGAVLMFGVGALVGVGALELWPTLVAAALGAVAGDVVSFWLGRHFHQRLRVLWPFRTHPHLITGATDFFYRHGGKSVLLGRFVGPLRPVIPAVAGMLDMPTGRFVAANLSSAALWAPAYLLPGMVFAASLNLAAEVATRLAVFVVVIVAIVLAVVWAVRRSFDFLHPRTHAMVGAILRWSRGHPVVGELPASLLDPEHPEARGLTLLALLLVAAAAGFAFLLQAAGGTALADLNTYVYELLQELRTEPMDRVMVAVTELGDGFHLLSVFTAGMLWLAWRRHWHAAVHWLAATAFIVLATRLLKFVTHLPRPVELYEGIRTFTFPSGHTTYSLVVYGFLAVLAGRELSMAARRIVYAFAAAFISLVAFSRLYLGAHWLSDVIGGALLGLTWVAFVGIAYRRHPRGRVEPLPLLAVCLLATATSGAWRFEHRMEADLERYAPPASSVEFMDPAHWRTEGWTTLDSRRTQLGPRPPEPLTLQYAGAVGPLRERLEEAGWERPPALTASSWLRWFGGDRAGGLPLLPQLHHGTPETLVMTRALTPGSRHIIRLWRSTVVLEPGETPVYVGYAGRIRVESVLGLFRIPRTVEVYSEPEWLAATFADGGSYRVTEGARRVLLMNGTVQ